MSRPHRPAPRYHAIITSIGIAASLFSCFQVMANSLQNNTQDLYLHLAQGQPSACPVAIAPHQTVTFPDDLYYCGYDICSSDNFDPQNGCQEISMDGTLTDGGYATYVGLHPQASNVSDILTTDGNTRYSFDVSQPTTTLFQLNGLQYRSIIQKDDQGRPVQLANNIQYYSQLPWRGINLSGTEYDGTYFDALFQLPDLPDMQYYSQQGMNTVRLPIRWEFLISDNTDNLIDSTHPNSRYINTVYLNAIHNIVKKYLDNGVNVILDLHNYMRFCKTGSTFGQTNEPTSPGCEVIDPHGSGQQLSHVWSIIATRMQDLAHSHSPASQQSQLVFELMNEPYADQNEFTTQALMEDEIAAAEALRQQGISNWIIFDGNNWTGLHSWTTQQDSDGQTNADVFNQTHLNHLEPIAIDVHQYFNNSFSGTTADCMAPEDFQQAIHLAAFTQWMQTNKLAIFLGEFGGSTQDNCLTDMRYLLDWANQHRYTPTTGGVIGWTAWRSNRNLTTAFNSLQAANPHVYCLDDGTQCAGIKAGAGNPLMTSVLGQYLTKPDLSAGQSSRVASRTGQV